ncbi:fasciclin-like arabinogalactan protein 13 [Cucurbita maxima]|uniref:Fasciclin-like arabinogalactan protein 13 n=1 Tax=Cucurbita maxima TaxID=3661 RepID=A0A6J1HX98_CUCMA|nr:fasciclin-like arabinogalactan protein 13 [Cucurbita maxima]
MASTALPLLLLPFVLFSQTLAQAPINITGILAEGGQFSTFLRLLGESNLISQLENQLDNSHEGMTILAPSDNGFNALKSGTLNSLNDQQKSQLLLFHVLSKFFTVTDLQTVSNPMRTLAGDWGLNFTGQPNSNQVNVSTGVVTVEINNKLREKSPLGVYVVDQVLLPDALFGKHAGVPPPRAPGPRADNSPDEGNPPESDAANPPSDETDGGVRNGVGLGLVLGFGLIAISLLF